MEWLKEYAKSFVEEDKMESFVEGFKKEFPKHAALKKDFNARGDEIDTLKGQLEKMNGDLLKAQESKNPNEELKAELDRITGEFDTFKQESSKRESQRDMKDQLKTHISKTFNDDAVDLLLSTFNLDELTTNEKGEIVDLEAKLGRLKEERPSLVKELTPESPKPKDKQTPPEVDTSKMTDDEYYAAKKAEKEGK